MKTLAFAFAFLSMFSVMGRTQPIKQNGGSASTINTTNINAVTGSFSGSVTASSVTFQAAKNTGAYATPGVGQNLLEVRDTTTQAAGVGGGLLFTGAYTGASITDAGAIQAQKSNSTAGNYSFDMTFHTRVNGGTNAERMRITDGGSVGIGTASPATTLDVNGNAQFGSGATKSTFTATGNLGIDAAAGISQGTSIATMSVTGMLAFQSSSTISGSTFTATTTQLFGSYIMPANTLFKIGDAVEVECQFKNTGSVSGAFQGTYMGGSLTYAQNATANAYVTSQIRITLVAAGTAMAEPSGRVKSVAGNAVALTMIDNSVVSPFAFDATASKTFQCEGRNSSGGTVDFMWMKVSKL